MKKTILLLLIFTAFFCYKVVAQYDHYLMPAKKNGKWGFINRNGAWIIDSRFDEAYYFTEGLSAVNYNGQWGYIDRHGGWVIEPQFNQAKPFSDGLACVVSNNHWGYINKMGEWHFKPHFKIVSSFSEDNAVVKSDEGFVFIDRNGVKILPHNFEHGLPFSEGLAFVIYNGHQGYIELSGNWLIKHDYDEAYSFSEGMALIKTSNKYGFIDQKGSLVIPAVFEDAKYFKEGLASVKKHDKWGYINRSGQVVIESRFEMAFPFSNDHAVVKSGGRFGLINKQGQWVIMPTFSGLGRYTKALSLEEQVQDYVFSMYADWQLKGEFEKSSTYLERVSEENSEMEINRITLEAINSLARRYVRLDQADVGLYEADHEKFNVSIPGAKNILLPVPIEYAKDVKEKWHEVWLRKPTYTISGDEFLINSLEVRYKGQVFYYEIDQDYRIGSVSALDLNSNDIIYNLPKISGSVAEGLPSEAITMLGQSDVDVSIPFTDRQNPKIFALVVGNEDYSSFQMELNTDTNVDFAAVDATIFHKYLINTLGVPKENITLLINATAGQMRQSIAKLSAIAEAFEGEARLLFYYAGHGLPREGSNEPYLIPVDVSSSNLDYAIKLEDVYKKLTEHKSESVTVFLDACFTGGARKQSLIAARGVRIKPKSPLVLGNLIVFSASSEDQTAHPYRGKAHGIFTYYLLKALQISNGEMSYGELADFVRTNVMRKSVLVNNRVQVPNVEVSPVLESTWQGMRFFEISAVTE